MFVQIGRCDPLKIDAFFFIRTIGFTFWCMDWGLIVTLKGGWGKRGSESLPGGFWGFRIEFWDIFFSNHESRRENRNGGLGSSFQRTVEETKEERCFRP